MVRSALFLTGFGILMTGLTHSILTSEGDVVELGLGVIAVLSLLFDLVENLAGEQGLARSTPSCYG